MSDMFRRVLAITLANLLLFPMTPLRAQNVAVEAPADSYAAPDVSPSTLSTANAGSGVATLKSPEVPVSAQGNFQTSIGIQIPPGRAGMQPSLAISYDSGSAKQASAFGAGWSLSLSEISRSLTNGYPKIVRQNNELSFAETEAAEALFAIDGMDLAELPSSVTTVPERVWAGSVFFAPRRGTDATILEYSAQDSAWVVHHPDGKKSAYGRDPKSTKTAIVTNELGVFRWLLIRQWNVNGDRVVYNYYGTDQAARSNKIAPQDEPVLSSVKWGGNDNIPGADPFEVRAVFSARAQGETNVLRGNVMAGAVGVDSLTVCGPQQTFRRTTGSTLVGTASSACGGQVMISQYNFAYDKSKDSGRFLLSSVSQVVPGVLGESFSSTRSFSYTGNNGKVTFGAPVKLTNSTEMAFLGVRDQRGLGAPPRENWSVDDAVTPPLTGAGTKVLDADGDGRSDIVYHPAGVLSPEAKVLSTATPLATAPISEGGLEETQLFGTIARSARRSASGNFVAFAARNIRSDFNYSDITNVTRDSVVDGVRFPVEIDKFRPPFAPSRGQCFTNAFWRICGTIDPEGEPATDMCRFTTTCEEQSLFDMSMCFAEICWIDEALLSAAFSDVFDWDTNPITTPAGRAALDEAGMSITDDLAFVGVPESELRARLNLELYNDQVHAPSAWKTLYSTSPLTGGLMDQCGRMAEWCASARTGPAVQPVCTSWDSSGACTAYEFGGGFMRVLVHSEDSDTGRTIPRIPLHFWPANVGKMLSLVGEVDLGNNTRGPPYHSSIKNDFLAPITDINADGSADIVLLRSTTAEINKTYFEFSPRAYLFDENIGTVDDYEYGFNSDWVRASRGATTPTISTSDFTESLNQILVGGVDFQRCAFGVCDQEQHRYLLGAGYNSLVQDVNADGLPDLVVGKPDPVYASTCRNLDLPPDGESSCYYRENFSANPGHDIYLNRGYRFGWIKSGSTQAESSFKGVNGTGPWEQILKGDLTPRNTAERPSSLGKIPLQVTSFADVNGDGRGDITAWYSPRTSLTASTDPAVRRVWLNQGDNYTLMPSDYFVLNSPPDRLSFGETLNNDELAPDTENRVRAILAGDLARLEDMNDDGLVDIFIPGEACSLAIPGSTCTLPPLVEGVGEQVGTAIVYPARVMYNLGVAPDLLDGISEVDGGLTAVDYVVARNNASVVDPSDYVPGGKVVVSAVEFSVEADNSSLVELSYGPWMKSNAAGVSLGFRHVSAQTKFISPSGIRGPVTSTKYYTDDPEGDYARRGLPVIEEVEAGSDYTAVENTYNLVQPYAGAKVYRVDLDDVLSTSCVVAAGGACLNQLSTKREVLVRNAFGAPTTVQEGDYTNGQYADATTTETAYDVRTSLWMHGLVSSTRVKGTKFPLPPASPIAGAVLQERSSVYDASGRLTRTTDIDVTSATCGSLDSVFEVLGFDLAGNPSTIQRNGTRTTVNYGSNYLYPSTVTTTVAKFVDGVASGSTTLVAQQQFDVRNGNVWSSVDPNNAVVENQFDGLGRATNSYDATGLLVRSVSYGLFGTETTEIAWLTPTAGRKTVTTTDAAGNVVSRVAYDTSASVDSNPVRLEYNVVDVGGAVYKSFSPEKTAAAPLPSSFALVRTFDDAGRVATETAPGNRVTRYSYPSARVLRATDPLNIVTQTTSDWRGNPTNVQRGAAQTYWQRDSLGRVVRLIDADLGYRFFEYDNGGNLTRWTLPRASSGAVNNTFSQCFNADGDVISFSDPDGRTVQNTYDGLGRQVVSSVKDDLSTTPVRYTVSYDGSGANRLGRVWRSTDPAGALEQGYDANGRPATATRTFATALGGIAALTTVSTWGRQGEVKTTNVYGGTSAASPSVGSLALAYTAGGRVSAVTDAGTELVGSIFYDAFDKPTSFKVGSTPTVATDRVTATIARHAATRDLTGLVYSRPNRVLTQLGLAGHNGYGAPGSETRTGTLDAAGNGVNLAKVWTYDTNGRLRTERITKSGVVAFDETYTYSPGGRVQTATQNVTATTETYAYTRLDLSGAVTNVSASSGGRSLTYYNNGAVKTDTKAGLNRTASFSAVGCLRRLQLSSGPKLEQSCDISGNPLVRSTTTSTGAKTTVMNLGLSELRSEENLVVHRIPVAGLVTMELAYNTSGGRNAAQSKMIMSDGRGSVLAVAPLLGSAGANVDATQDFDAWGKPIALGAAKPKHGYVDHEPDAVFGTYSFGRRVYDPQLRRWLSADPLVGPKPEADLTETTQLDLWGYAACNPVLNTDKSGMLIPLAAVVVLVAITLTWNGDSGNTDITVATPDPRAVVDAYDAGKTFVNAPTLRNAKPFLVLGAMALAPKALGKLADGVKDALVVDAKAARAATRTAPTLPDKKIAEGGGVTVEHNYRSNDHGPAHAHVVGEGDTTRIGRNGKPLAGDPELTPKQAAVVKENKSTIRNALGKIGRWLDFNEEAPKK